MSERCNASGDGILKIGKPLAAEIPIVPPEESMSECAVYEVIETLVKELDNHGYGDMHWFPREYRDPSVEAALAVGRVWLAAHQKEETNEGEEL